MKIFNASASVAIALFLQACGSSSDSPAPADFMPIEKTFTFTSSITNSCGVSTAFTDVDVFLQDENWVTIEKSSPDVNGVVTFTTLDEKINYTVVAKTQQGDGPESIIINSFIQAETTNPASYQAQHDGMIDENSCECITRDVLVTHQMFTSVSSVYSSANYTNSEQIDGEHTRFNGVDICPLNESEWPVISFNILGLDAASPALKTGSALFLKDFDAANDVMISAFATIPSREIELPTVHQAFSSNLWIQGNQHFKQEIEEDVPSILLFNSHGYTSESLYQSNAVVTLLDKSSLRRALLIKSKHQKISSDYQTSLGVKASLGVQPSDSTNPLNIDVVDYSELGTDGKYDYSAVAGYPLAIVSHKFSKKNSTIMNFYWTIHGSIKGQLPVSVTNNDGTTDYLPTSVELLGYETLMDNTDFISTDVYLLKSAMSNDYSDYISYTQNMKAPSNDVNNLANDLHTYHIKYID